MFSRTLDNYSNNVLSIAVSSLKLSLLAHLTSVKPVFIDDVTENDDQNKHLLTVAIP